MNAKIDLEKFICSYVKYSNIQDALKDQGLKCWNGEIVEIESEDERIASAIRRLLETEKRESNLVGYFGVTYEEATAWLEKQGDKTSKWTEEDDTIRRELIRRMEALDHYWNRPNDQKLIDWLKSLKQRMEEEQ